MGAVVDVVMSGRCFPVFSFLWLVTQFLGYFVSNALGLCGRDVCVFFKWMGWVWLWLCVSVVYLGRCLNHDM